MKELLEESKEDGRIKEEIEKVFGMFNVKISRNENVNYAVLLYISNAYYSDIYKIKDVYEEYDRNISSLYKYNKIKDTAQEILGKIAEIKGITNREIGEEYEVPE